MARSRTAPDRTRQRTAQRRQMLREDVTRSQAPHRVDREAGVIYGVKVLGRHSANGRTYTPAAIHEARPLYEGKAVNINHPKKARDPRDAADRFGKLVNVRLGDDGDLYADLHYLKSHPMADRICEAAERMPDAFGLSHNAQGDVETVEGKGDVVHKVVEVRSVDLVCDPATTNGLFEQRQQRPMKIKAFFEAILKRPAVQQLVKGKAKRGLLRKLLAEDDTMTADMPAASGDAGAADGADDDKNLADEDDPEAALAKGFRAAVIAVVDDDSMSASDKQKKIGELLRTHEKLCAKAGNDSDEGDSEEDTPEDWGGFGGGSGADAGDYSDAASVGMGDAESGANFGESEGCEPDKGKKGKTMTPEQRVRQLERREKARDLIESANLSWDKAEDRTEFLGLLLETTTPAAMAKLVEREKKVQHLAGQQTRRPRSGNTSGSTSLAEQKAGIDTIEGTLALLRS